MVTGFLIGRHCFEWAYRNDFRVKECPVPKVFVLDSEFEAKFLLVCLTLRTCVHCPTVVNEEPAKPLYLNLMAALGFLVFSHIRTCNKEDIASE